MAEAAVAGATSSSSNEASAILSPDSAPSALQHKLGFSCTLPGGEAVLSPPILSAASATDTTTAGSAVQRLHWDTANLLSVDEKLVRNLAATNAAMLMTLTSASCSLVAPAAVSPSPAANAASGSKAANPAAKAVAVVEEVPWQGEQQLVVPLDLAPLLVGQTGVVLTLPLKGLSMPLQLQAFSSLSISLQVCTAPPAPVQPSPAEAKVAAAKAKADPKAAAAAAEAAAAALAAQPVLPCCLLSPALAAQLNPIIVTPRKVTRLPDAPATAQQLDTLCHPCSVSFKLPLQSSTHKLAAQVTDWQQGSTTDGGAVTIRKLLLTGSAVVLAGDLAVDDFLLACAEQPVIFEVHDRDAKAQQQGFRPATPPVITTPQLKGKAGKIPVKAPAAATKTPVAPAKAVGKVPAPAPAAAEAASQPDVPSEASTEYVCGVAKCSLAGLARGGKQVEVTANVLPYTSVRGAAGLEWSSRPGRYVEAGTTIKVLVRSHLPLTETLAAQQASLPRPYSRAVFIFDYADSQLLHSIEDLVRSQNVQCLGLHKTPAGASARARAASVVGSRAVDSRSVVGSSPTRLPSGSLPEDEPFELTVPMLQSLSTFKLTPGQAADPTLDLLTGFQMVDGKERIIVVEGLAEGAMRGIEGIALASLDGSIAQPASTRLRAVHWHTQVRYKSRLYADLGLNLWIVKMCQPLPVIEAQAASYATGKVRQECVGGLKRVVALRRAEWSRQVATLNLLPSSAQLILLDKKFGGELTQQDVHGVDVEPVLAVPSSRSFKRGASFRSSRSRAMSAASGDDAQSQQDLEEGEGEFRVDCWNGGFMQTKAQAAAVREQQDWLAHNRQLLQQLQASRHALRETWAAWNPQRAASHKLQQQVQSGQISLEDTVTALRQAVSSSSSSSQNEGMPWEVSAAEAKARGWHCHAGPFVWPAPKDAQAFTEHPDKPSQARCDELAQPWHDPYTPEADARQANQFMTIMPAAGLFGKDGSYWQSVHQTGEGLEKERQEAAAKAKEAWQSKVVVDNINMHTALPQRQKPSQLDRLEPLLKDEPRKLGFKMAPSPAAPYSMFTAAA